MKESLEEQAKRMLKEDYAHLLSPKKALYIIAFVTLVNILLAVLVHAVL